MIPSVTFAELAETPVRGDDGVRRGRVRLGAQMTPCEAIVLPSWDGERRPYAAGDRVLVVVSEGGDINAGVYVVAQFVPEQQAPANSHGAHVIRAPRGKLLFLAPDDEGGGFVVLGDARPSGWGNDGIALVSPIEQQIASLQSQINALALAVDTRAQPLGALPIGAGTAVTGAAGTPAPLDWAKGVMGVTGGNGA